MAIAWYVFDENQVEGPYDTEDVQEMVENLRLPTHEGQAVILDEGTL